jgi:hypothetical protein
MDHPSLRESDHSEVEQLVRLFNAIKSKMKNEAPRRRAARYQYGKNFITRRERRGINPKTSTPVPFSLGRRGAGDEVN